MQPVTARQACFSAALAVAAVSVASPPFSWPSPAPAAQLADTAAQPVSGPFLASYAPSPSASAPRTSDDTESFALIPSPRPVKSRVRYARPRRHVTAAPAPAYTPLPSASGAYGSPQAYAESLVGGAQFACLEPLWNRESGWSAYAENPASGAYGIPQALPGWKMASAGADWRTDGDTQVRWGIQYLDDTYGSPCGGWAHEEAYGWY